MPEISKITLPSGTTYDLADAHARELIENLSGFTKFLGVTTTALTDGATTNPITINSESVTASSGDIATYNAKEFIFNGTSWAEFGDLSALGTLAYKNSISVSTTAAGSVSAPTFTGDELTASGSFTPAGTCTGAAVEMNTTTVNSITNVGSLPTFTVSNEVLTIGAGTLPTKGANTTVCTGVNSVTQPTFTGTAGAVEVTGTPAGTVSQPTFTGTAAAGVVTYNPS